MTYRTMSIMFVLRNYNPYHTEIHPKKNTLHYIDFGSLMKYLSALYGVTMLTCGNIFSPHIYRSSEMKFHSIAISASHRPMYVYLAPLAPINLTTPYQCQKIVTRKESKHLLGKRQLCDKLEGQDGSRGHDR